MNGIVKLVMEIVVLFYPLNDAVQTVKEIGMSIRRGLLPVSISLRHPLVLVGKSMGSRVSCMVASTENITVSAIICLRYPLKGMNGKVRDEILLQLSTPTMFVQFNFTDMSHVVEFPNLIRPLLGDGRLPFRMSASALNPQASNLQNDL